ncbi:hypothetical protein Tco_1232722 [Tanacetum coccineum]
MFLSPILIMGRKVTSYVILQAGNVGVLQGADRSDFDKGQKELKNLYNTLQAQEVGVLQGAERFDRRFRFMYVHAFTPDNTMLFSFSSFELSKAMSVQLTKVLYCRFAPLQTLMQRHTILINGENWVKKYILHGLKQVRLPDLTISPAVLKDMNALLDR